MNLPKRKSIRLYSHDYGWCGDYFVTICTKKKQRLFGRLKGGELHLNARGMIAYTEWYKTLRQRKNISLGAFAMSTNHLHGIIRIEEQLSNDGAKDRGFESPSQTLGAIVRGYKVAVTSAIKYYESTRNLELHPNRVNQLEGSIWKRNYHERILRTKIAYRNVRNYINRHPPIHGIGRIGEI